MKCIFLIIILPLMALKAFGQGYDNQNATLSTTVPTMIALRPYFGIENANNQGLTATVTNATDVLSTNHFEFTGNFGYNELAYKIYSNVYYKVSLQVTGGDAETPYFIRYYAETLPSPENGLSPFTSNYNTDHVIDVPDPTTLSDAVTSSVQILHNSVNHTGKIAVGGSYLPEPERTDFAAFGIKLSMSPGFSLTPGNYSTSLTITASSL